MSKTNGITEPLTSAHNAATEEAIRRSVSERVTNAAHDAIDHASPKLEQIERKLREGSEETSAYLREKTDMAKEKFNSGVEQSRSFARENPILTLGAAFTAGALIATLIGKRK